jgi:hypothetical protein
MPAINVATTHYALVKRSSNNWPSKNRGVMVVFCVIGTIAIIIVALSINKALTARRQRKDKEAFQQGQ